MTSNTQLRSVIVVGGGLAGLAAAGYLARDGHRVTVLERSSNPGGRAQTKRSNGFLYNQGPHALYRGGEAEAVLTELGVPLVGNAPKVAGVAVRKGRMYTLPSSGRTMLSTRLFGMRARVEAGRALLSLRKGEVERGRTLREWLDSEFQQPASREYAEAIMRLSTYANAPEHIDLADAARQFARASDAGVIYLDGGWQTLVDGLEERLDEAGGQVLTSARAVSVERGERGYTVTLADGRPLAADAVVIAAAPSVAAGLVPGSQTLRAAVDAAVPARAACLDVALSRLPRPGRTFGLGIDVPLYFSVHTRTAQLAPAGHDIVSVAKYLHPGAPHDPAGSLAELEQLLDLAQPGWRAFEVDRQFLPEMTVSTDIPRAADGGLEGRRGPAIPEFPGVFMAGDWVGDHGWLADATLGSAREAALLASRHLSQFSAPAPAMAVS